MKPKVKICGVTNAEDGALALSLGADELGFVLAPSPRRIEPEALKALLDALRGEGRLPSFRAIGVFVNERTDAMRDIIAYCGLDAAQVHGDETPADCGAFGFPWYRALRIGSVADAGRLVHSGWGCPRILVDASPQSAIVAKQKAQPSAQTEVAYGGTGKSVGTWAALAARDLARDCGKEFFVAGGIGPRSVASAIWSLSPDGIDASSGIEERPGRKSREKLEALFAKIAEARNEREKEGAANAAR
jgi:phosphoribosylanthranilate isomerase